MSTWSTTTVYDKFGRQNIAYDAHQDHLIIFNHYKNLARAPEEFEIFEGVNQLLRPPWETEIQQLNILLWAEARKTVHLCVY